jgi:5-hydroxyisourate hydrolase
VISTHVLDTAAGHPATGIPVRLEKGGEQQESGVTDADGRVRFGVGVTPGTYRLVFDTAHYFPESFFPEVAVTFTVTAATEHYHVPILLSPFAFSTYRGS